MIAMRLKKGDTIGVVVPSKCGREKDEEAIKNAEKYFNSLGLKVKYGKYILEDTDYPVATPKERAEEINKMFADNEISAIFTLKGGDLANGLLPYIDYDLIKNNPKIIIGMSDITTLLCAIYEKTGLVTFHGNDYVYFGSDKVTEYDKNEIINKLFNVQKEMIPYGKREYYNINESIKGKVMGTNIRTLLKLIGTEYLSTTKDYIYFLEGYSTDINQWNSSLEQMKQIGMLNKAIVFGYNYNLEYINKNTSSIIDEIKNILPKLPFVKTEDFGHIHPNAIIPIGAEILIENNEIKIIEEYLK